MEARVFAEVLRCTGLAGTLAEALEHDAMVHRLGPPAHVEDAGMFWYHHRRWMDGVFRWAAAGRIPVA